MSVGGEMAGRVVVVCGMLGLLVGWAQGAGVGELRVVAGPSELRLGEGSRSLSTSDVMELNRNLLGVSATQPSFVSVSAPLLRRAEALVLFLQTAEPFQAEASAVFPLHSLSLSSLHAAAKEDHLNWVDMDSGDVPKADGVPDIILKTVHSSEELAESLHLLRSKYGEDGVVAELISIPQRTKRQAEQEEETQKEKDSSADAAAPATATPPPAAAKNPNQIYAFSSPNYSAAFHIILFAGLVIGLASLCIGCGMWDMDPGKDSIIYRMTMTRAKKD